MDDAGPASIILKPFFTIYSYFDQRFLCNVGDSYHFAE